VTDILSPGIRDGSSTPSGEPEDDFFSSWDKPAIKKPSNPPSRTQTPVISRTASPFLTAAPNSSNTARAKTPLSSADSEAAPTASRTTSSSAIRKTISSGGPRKANVLGAKKTQKLGAKKLTGAEGIDFEAAEKKAKEEAERIERLGYDPDAEDSVTETTVTSPIDKPKIASPTPISPPRASFGSVQAPGHQRTPSELERLGMGMGRLGFGQVGGAKPAAAATKPMGFGSVGASKAAKDGPCYPLFHAYRPYMLIIY
jgi:ADP-ribosylation factor GTPase-activating protein 2/3